MHYYYWPCMNTYAAKEFLAVFPLLCGQKGIFKKYSNGVLVRGTFNPIGKKHELKSLVFLTLKQTKREKGRVTITNPHEIMVSSQPQRPMPGVSSPARRQARKKHWHCDCRSLVECRRWRPWRPNGNGWSWYSLVHGGTFSSNSWARSQQSPCCDEVILNRRCQWKHEALEVVVEAKCNDRLLYFHVLF